jgi:hypothetical protein
MNTGSISDTDARLMDEAIAWTSELNAIVPPDETRPTMTYIILTGTRPNTGLRAAALQGAGIPNRSNLGTTPYLGRCD